MITGILLAAGSGSRFGGGKLLHPLADGTPIGAASLRKLRRAVADVVVVVRDGDTAVRSLFEQEGARVVVSAKAHLGMGHSLAAAVEAARDAAGWIVALADMPFLREQTIAGVAARLGTGRRIVVPSFGGKRGHPVGFGQPYFGELLVLEGDAGARALLSRHATEVEVVEFDDPGILRDIDTRTDL